MSIWAGEDGINELPRLERTCISVLDVYDAGMAADRTLAEAANGLDGLDLSLGEIYLSGWI